MTGITIVVEQFITVDDFLRLLMLIFFIAFFAWLITTLGNFFPSFFASVTQKYKHKKNIEIDYNRDLNVDYTARLLKYLSKKEIKSNHGKRLPFRR